MTLLVRAGSRLFIYFLIFLNVFERVMGTNVPCRPNFRLGMSGSAASCHSYPHAQLNLSVVNPPPLQEAKCIIKLRRRGGGVEPQAAPFGLVPGYRVGTFNDSKTPRYSTRSQLDDHITLFLVTRVALTPEQSCYAESCIAAMQLSAWHDCSGVGSTTVTST